MKKLFVFVILITVFVFMQSAYRTYKAWEALQEPTGTTKYIVPTKYSPTGDIDTSLPPEEFEGEFDFKG